MGCPGPANSEFRKILLSSDGTFVILGHIGENYTRAVTFHSFERDGELRVGKVLGSPYPWYVGGAALTSNGEVLVAGGLLGFPGVPQPVQFMRLDRFGNTILKVQIANSLDDNVTALFEYTNGEILVANSIGETTGSTGFKVLNSEGSVIRSAEDAESNCIIAVMGQEGDIVTLGAPVGPVINRYSAGLDLVSRIVQHDIDYKSGEYLYDFIVTQNGDTVVVGESFPSINHLNFLIARATASGELLWKRIVDIPHSTAYTVEESVDGSLYLGGRGGTAKLDADGNEVWRVNMFADVRDIAISSNGDVYAVGSGSVAGDTIGMLLLKFDADGSLLLERNY